MHERFEELLQAISVNTWARILDSEHCISFGDAELYMNLSALRRIFHGITQQIIGNGIHDMMVEHHLVSFIRCHKVCLQLLLLDCIPEVLVDITYKTHDFAWLNLQTQVACIDFAELHELVNQLAQSAHTTFRCLNGFSLTAPGLFKFIYGTADNCHRCAELMSNLSKEVGTEFRNFLFEQYLLAHFESLTLLAVEDISAGTYYKNIKQPSPPGVVPRLTNNDAKCSLVSIFASTQVEHIPAWRQTTIVDTMLRRRLTPVVIDSFEIELIHGAP